jgi:protocatechuate 3,4-dioxygenase beta subunit
VHNKRDDLVWPDGAESLRWREEEDDMLMEIMKGKSAGIKVTQPDAPRPGELIQTPREIEGPFFRLGAPNRSNLLEPGDKPGCVLSGRVLNPRGVPIPGAIVNLWSSDLDGNYDLIGYRYHGYQVCDEQGRYEFTTIIPACYEPRDAKHFHVKVQGNSPPITTQLYFGGEPGNEEDEFYSSLLEIKYTHTDEHGTKYGTYDFVIAQIRDGENVTPATYAARL